ncbi:MAG: LacI family transcriptional regulator [Lachnospiraceae bacterium]|nr:LacI family transcriptional regulator [Lachnospiraceae bacterium]MCI9151982.1 LacI family transcriptional regulator [Lachnospiraceae bacterium]
MPATIRDIKNRTGLSLATISKYLNGGNVLPKNRELIEEAIEALHYEVNEIARGLVTNQTKLVGVMVYDIESFFTGSMLHYIGNELRKHGYGVLICDSYNREDVEEESLRFLLNRKVDGILILPVSLSGRFVHPAREAGVPVVLIDRAFKDDEYDFVGIDNHIAAYRAVNILIENNHKRIAVMASDVEYSGIERLQGYLHAMHGAGLETPACYQKLGRHSFEMGYESMKELMALEEPPTGVFMGNYETTLGGIMAANELGMSWPEDISIIGFDDLIVSKVVRPKIWMAVQPMEAICTRAVEILLQNMECRDKGLPVKINFSARIQEGKSIRRLEEEG